MRRLALAFLATCLPGLAMAACDGRDLRATMSDEDRGIVAAYVDAAPYPEGNHWIARRGADVVHVIGTLHLGDPRLDAPVGRLRPVIEGAATLLLETTKAEEAKLRDRMKTDPSVLLLQGTTLPELMDEAAWQQLAKAAAERGVPAVMAAKFQPWYLAIMLSTPPCAREQLSNGTGLDAQLQAIAIEAGVPRQALEPYDTVFAVFAEAPLPQQIEMMQSSLIAPETSEDLLATLLHSYFEERHAEGWEVSRLLASRVSALTPEQADAALAEMQDKLLSQRNRDWIPVIEAALASPYIVVAAGGAHLHGEVGLLNLLAEVGFELSRAEF